MSELVSHGRGGAANFAKDDTPYTDGEITREGPTGDQGDGAYSAGRGGQGNIGKDGGPAVPGQQAGDGDVIPEPAVREHKPGNYHFGRGGAGNELHENKEDDSMKKMKTVEQHAFDKKIPHESLKDKVKDVFHKK